MFRLLLPMFVLVMATSCARVESDQSKVTFDISGFSKVMSSASNTADQAYPAFFTVSNVDKTGTPVHFALYPNEVRELSIERGEIIIQAIIFFPPDVNLGNDGGGMEPYYGFQKVLLDQPEQTISLSVKKVKDFVSGTVAGRVLTTNNSGPTGSIAYHFRSASDLPPIKMEMFNDYIVNGWFQTFAMHSPDFLGIEYLLPDGTNIFGQGAIKNVLNLYEGNGYQMQAAVPYRSSFYSSQFHGHREPEVYTLGFWGPGKTLANNKIYRGDFSSAEIYKYDSSYDETTPSPGATLSGEVSIWPADLSLIYQLTESSGNFLGHEKFYYRNGIEGPASESSIANALVYTLSSLEEGSKDSFGGFRGIFQPVNWKDETNFKIFRDATNKDISLLPGISLSSVSVYTSDQYLYGNHDFITCSGLKDGKHPEFTFFAGSANSGGVTITNSADGTITFSQFPSAKQVAICATTTAGFSLPRPVIFDDYSLPGPCSWMSTPTAGAVCDDGSIFLGGRDESLSPYTYYEYYLAPKASEAGSIFWGPEVFMDTLSEGPIATQDLLQSGQGPFPAAEYCSSGFWGGHQDWFLPTYNEWTYFDTNADNVLMDSTNGLQSSSLYWSSSDFNANSAYVYDTATWAVINTVKANPQKVRCMRRVSTSGP